MTILKSKRLPLYLLGAFFLVTPVWAQQGSQQGQAGVLDFEGDLIEGQRKRPDLFLQTEIQDLSLDAILYLRKDFNDFHQVDKNRRPGFFQKRTRRR